MHDDLREYFRRCAVLLGRATRERGLRSVVFASGAPGEGVTTAILGVAEQMHVLDGLRVLVIEMRLGARAGTAKIDRNRCVEGVLDGSMKLEDSAQEMPGLAGVWFLPSRSKEGVESGPAAIRSLMEAAESSFDLVLWDGGSLLSGSGGAALLSVVPTVVLVVQAGRLPFEVIEQVRRDLEVRGVTVIGSILNKHRRFIPKWIYSLIAH